MAPTFMTRVSNFFMLLMAGYLGLAAFSVWLHYLPGAEAILSQRWIDRLYFAGVAAQETNPLYRPWLLGFVREPGAPAVEDAGGDAYAAYGVKVEAQARRFEAVDDMGWRNRIPLSQARVLFLGGAACEGAGAGTALAIPARFEEKSAIVPYSACRDGYGLLQQQRLLERLTDKIHPQRFTGRTVYLLLDLGEDMTVNLDMAESRREEQQAAPRSMLTLAPLRALLRLLWSHWQGEPLAPLPWRVDAWAAPCPAATRVEDRRGYYPVRPSCASPNDPAYAFAPASRAALSPSWFDEKRQAEARASLKRLTELAKRRKLDLRVVLVPTKLQILAASLDPGTLAQDQPFARELPVILKNHNAVLDFMLQILAETKTSHLNLLPVLLKRNDVCRLFRPDDSHMGPVGYGAVVEAILQSWPRGAAPVQKAQ